MIRTWYGVVCEPMALFIKFSECHVLEGWCTTSLILNTPLFAQVENVEFGSSPKGSPVGCVIR